MNALEAKVDVFMPVYVGDYLKDTTDLTCEEHGAYLQLLFNLWNSGGTLRYDPRRLAMMVRLEPSRWEDVWATIRRFFHVDEAERTVSQKRVSVELEKARRQKVAKADAGRKGGEKAAANRRNRDSAGSSAKADQPAAPQQNGSSATSTGKAEGAAKRYPSPSPSPSPPESGSGRARAEEETSESESNGREPTRPTSHDVLHWFGLAFRDRYHQFWTPERNAPVLVRELLEDQIGALPPAERAAAYASVRARVAAYFALEDEALVKHRHPLKWFCERFNALDGSLPAPPDGPNHLRGHERSKRPVFVPPPREP